MSRYARIYAAVRSVPSGRVSTYGLIAEIAGLPGRARLVGTALRKAPDDLDLPWHRVLNASGRISFAAGSDLAALQRARLEEEGVPFLRGRVNLRRYGYPARDEHLDAALWSFDGSL